MHPRFRQIYAWVGYLTFFLASHGGMPLLAMASLGIGIACHWRFWRTALPLGFACFLLGLWWGKRATKTE